MFKIDISKRIKDHAISIMSKVSAKSKTWCITTPSNLKIFIKMILKIFIEFLMKKIASFPSVLFSWYAQTFSFEGTVLGSQGFAPSFIWLSAKVVDTLDGQMNKILDQIGHMLPLYSQELFFLVASMNRWNIKKYENIMRS